MVNAVSSQMAHNVKGFINYDAKKRYSTPVQLTKSDQFYHQHRHLIVLKK